MTRKLREMMQWKEKSLPGLFSMFPFASLFLWILSSFCSEYYCRLNWITVKKKIRSMTDQSSCTQNVDMSTLVFRTRSEFLYEECFFHRDSWTCFIEGRICCERIVSESCKGTVCILQNAFLFSSFLFVSECVWYKCVWCTTCLRKGKNVSSKSETEPNDEVTYDSWWMNGPSFKRLFPSIFGDSARIESLKERSRVFPSLHFFWCFSLREFSAWKGLSVSVSSVMCVFVVCKEGSSRLVTVFPVIIISSNWQSQTIS